MSRVFFAICLTVFLTGGTLAILKAISLQTNKPEKIANTGVDMQFRKMANGSIVYEEVPSQGYIEDIEPAAGDTRASTEPRFKYDPLTQTYRIQTIDRHGNKGQTILRDPRNP